MAAHLHLAPSPPADESGQTESAPIRVVLADDHGLMRRSLRLLLDHDERFEVIAMTQDLRSTVLEVREERPRVLVLDLGMPDGSSFHTIVELRERAPDTEIVALSMNDNVAFARGALDAGALGFVLKEHADEELPRAVCAAARSEQFISPRVAARLTSPLAPVSDV